MTIKIYKNLKNETIRLIGCEKGVTTVEYGIILSLVASVILVVFRAEDGGVLYDAINSLFSNLSINLNNLLRI